MANLVAELVDRRLAEESAPETAPSRGRPSLVVSPRKDGPTVLAVDVGVDSIATAIIGFGGRILSYRRSDRPRSRLAPAVTIDDIARSAYPQLQEFGASCVSISAAVAGMVDEASGVVLLAPNLGWRNVDFGQELARALHSTLPVLVGNEADLGALAERTRGAGLGYRDIIYISGEVGVGAGVFIGGKAMIGASGQAGEVGHMILNTGGRLCRCGGRGCWETEVGEDALLRHYGADPAGGRAAVDRLLIRAGEGDAAAKAALSTVSRWLTLGLVSLSNVFGPQAIILDGLFSRLFPFIREELEQDFGRRALAPTGGQVRILTSHLDGKSALYGAAEKGFDRILRNPTLFPTSASTPWDADLATPA
ncbi:ROK family protein [Micromonospora sp. BQ11]|uniref:ROK family protein n=1 Tax=Micromonospora sp. BQ11 TaxID=3452212 RepID=UPI003F8893BD